MLVGVECNLLLVQKWKCEVIKQWLQVTNVSASLGMHQAGNPALTHMSGTISKGRQRAFDFITYLSGLDQVHGQCVMTKYTDSV